MAVKTLLRMGNPKIYQPCATVTEFDTPALHELITDLIDTKIAHEGVGIAAPQIGVNLRVMIYGFDNRNLRYPEKTPVPVTACINPTYEVLDETIEEDGEGCLCLPTLYGIVPRVRAVKMTYQDVKGETHTVTEEDFPARIIQHECDHLDGKIYPMRIADLRNFGFHEEIRTLDFFQP